MRIMSRLFNLPVLGLISLCSALAACSGGPYPADAHAFVWKRESQSDAVATVALSSVAVNKDRADVSYVASRGTLKFSMPLACAGTVNRTVTWTVELKQDSFEHGTSSETRTITLPAPEGVKDSEQYEGLSAECIAARPSEPFGEISAPMSFKDYPVTVRWAVCQGRTGSFDTDIVAHDEVLIDSDEKAKGFAITIRKEQLQRMASMEDAEEFTTSVEVKPYQWKNEALATGQKIFFTSNRPLKRSAVESALGGGMASAR